MALDLKHLLRVARRWWWILLLAPILGGGAAYYRADQQPRMYASDATLLINAGVSTTNAGSVQASRSLSETYSGWVVSRPVLQNAADALDYPGGADALQSHVSSEAVADTLFITVSATSTSPEEAANIANVVAEQFILDAQKQNEAQHAQVRSGIDQQITDTEASIAELDASIDKLRANEADLSPSDATRLQSLLSERSDLQDELDQLVTTVRSIDVEFAAAQTRIVIQSPAVAPNAPYAPQVMRSAMIGAALGVVVAVAGVILLEYLDDTVRSSDQFSRLSSSPMLASVARAPSLRRRGSGLFVLDEPQSAAAEAMRLLRANLEFASAPDRLTSLVVTSPETGDGKSTITANLGVVMAQAGLNTVIVDADLRRPMQHRIFGIENSRGLSTLLVTPDPDWREELIGLSIPNLMLVPSGPLPPNPSDLLSLDRFNAVLKGLSEWADIVLVDCPPALAASDALVVSARTKGTVLVCRQGQTRRGMLRRATSALSHGHARLVGVVLNQARTGEVDHYGQYEGSTHHADSSATRYYFGKAVRRPAYHPNGTPNGKLEPTAHRSGQ